jgi:hypothetical protein
MNKVILEVVDSRNYFFTQRGVIKTTDVTNF